MSESAFRNESYGNYILRTGTGVIGQYELLLGEFYYHRFKGRRRVLDIGPGRCWFTKQNPDAITAIDNSPEIVAHYFAEGIDIRLGDAYDLGVPDSFADGAFCCWVFEHLPDPLRALNEIYRVLQKGGYGMIVVPTPDYSFWDDYTHVRPFTHVSLRQLAEDSGFSRFEVSYMPFARGSMQLLKFFGMPAIRTYLSFSDTTLRKLGLVNPRNAVLEFWKD